MKKLLIFSFICCFILSSCNRYPKDGQHESYIEVIGSAELEVEPDEIHLAVVIGNYSEKYRTGASKELLSLDAADKKFMDILANVGIDKSQIVLKDASTQNYWSYYIRYGRYMENVRLEKQYEIILNEVSQLNNLLKELPGPQDGIVSVNVTELKNKNIAEHRKEAKIMAMKAAKEKASYLLESIGSKTGKPIYVKEVVDDNNDVKLYRARTSNMLMKQESAFIEDSSEEPQMKKIKLRYEIEAKFEIL